jgi:D-alanyl-D-alanine carboxypeptidase
MVRSTVRLIPASMRRFAIRSLIALALVGVVAGGSFGLLPLPSEPRGSVANAAPSEASPGGPSGSPGTSPVESSTSTTAPSPTATPPASPTRTSSPAPTAGASVSSPTSGAPITVPSQVDATRPVVAIPAGTAPTATDATRRALTLRLRTLRATYGIPGVSAAILFADGTMWRATSGWADVGAKRRVTMDTEFAVASISKTFLATLTLVLVEEGKLGLDTPVVSYLPDLAIDPSITVRQLLDHTSGLYDYFYAPDIDEVLLADRKRVWTADEMLAYVGKPYFKPGRGWHYSNTNYLILGLLAESIEGAPLAEQLRTRFLVPLGLDHTHYQGVEAPLGPVARAYRFDGPGLRLKPIPLTDGTAVVPFTSVVTAAGSAGSIASTAEDLVTWARALYGGSVLTPESLAAMVTDAQATAQFKPSILYGLGVQAATIDGRPTLGHSGRLLGSRSVVRWLPDERIAIAVTTNQSRNDPSLIARALLRVVLGTPVPCTGCAPSN